MCRSKRPHNHPAGARPNLADVACIGKQTKSSGKLKKPGRSCPPIISPLVAARSCEWGEMNCWPVWFALKFISGRGFFFFIEKILKWQPPTFGSRGDVVAAIRLVSGRVDQVSGGKWSGNASVIRTASSGAFVNRRAVRSRWQVHSEQVAAPVGPV